MLVAVLPSALQGRAQREEVLAACTRRGGNSRVRPLLDGGNVSHPAPVTAPQTPEDQRAANVTPKNLWPCTCMDSPEARYPKSGAMLA